MKFLAPLTEGKILKRYKRFLADIQLSSGEVITAHTANTGSMKTCWEPGWKVLISFHDNPKRKLKYSLEMTHNGQTWIGINTSLPNKFGQEAIENGLIKS
jgi:DNA-binding protein, stimulates sugar fermentation